jgi:AraC family transcriptional regulator
VSIELAPGFVRSIAEELDVDLVRGDARSARRPARGGLAPHVLARVVELVRLSYDTPLSLADLAKVAGLSPYHFARQFHVSTGVAPHAYVVRARVHEAARLILAGERLDDAAARVGFAGRGHLSRHMRRWMGVAPGALAREARRASASY